MDQLIRNAIAAVITKFSYRAMDHHPLRQYYHTHYYFTI